MSRIATSKGIMNINIDSSKANANGEVYVVCPICTPDRKPEHQKEKKLAVNVMKYPNPWRCNHCGEGGYILTDEYIKRLKIKPLMLKDKSIGITDNVAKWFWDKRRISLQTLKDFRVSVSEENIYQQRNKDPRKKGKYLTRHAINFKYFKDDVLINIKFRDANKNFKAISGASLIFYNIDSIKDCDEAIITEGEIDAMSYHEVGIKNVISVPNGVTITKEELEIFKSTGKLTIKSSLNLEYLDNCIDDLKHIKKFIIATDDDPAGIKLREELARRLGYEKCVFIKYGEYKDEYGNPIKDANELLVKRGKEVLAETIKTARSFPIDTVTLSDMYLDELLKNYRIGRIKGISTGYKSLDPYFNWVFGWPYVINGFPNMGKTTFVLNLAVIASVLYDWKWGIYSPENYPVSNIIEMIAMILYGKPIEEGYSKRISEDQLIEAAEGFIKKHFFFVDNENGFTPEELRIVKKRLIKQHGIVGFITDPWSSLNQEMKGFGSIDDYLLNELNNEVRLTTKYNIINIICHHPKTPKSKIDITEPPSAFELTGGKYWWIKMYGIGAIHQEVYDDWRNNMVGFHVQKMKDKHKGGETTGRNNYPIFRYDKLSRRFYEKNILSKDDARYNIFPFKNFNEREEQKIFEGF